MRSNALFLFGALALTMASASCVAQSDKPRQGAYGDGSSIFNFKAKAVKPKPAKAGKCDGTQHCLIEITVTAGKPCTITLAHDYVVIESKNKFGLVWKVTGGDWTFVPDKGIEIYSPGTEFGKGSVNPADPREYGIEFVGAKNKWYYGYAINLKDKSGNVCSIDPGLITDWP